MTSLLVGSTLQNGKYEIIRDIQLIPPIGVCASV